MWLISETQRLATGFHQRVNESWIHQLGLPFSFRRNEPFFWGGGGKGKGENVGGVRNGGTLTLVSVP